jgi:hypothetical protein
MKNVYDKFSQGFLYEWVTPRNNFMKKYKLCVINNNVFTKTSQHYPILLHVI